MVMMTILLTFHILSGGNLRWIMYSNNNNHVQTIACRSELNINFPIYHLTCCMCVKHMASNEFFRSKAKHIYSFKLNCNSCTIIGSRTHLGSILIQFLNTNHEL